VIVAPNLVAINEISVQIIQFHIAFSHIFPVSKPKLEIRDKNHRNTTTT